MAGGSKSTRAKDLVREVRANPRHDVNDTEDDITHERRTKARHDVNVAATDNTHGGLWGKRAKKDYPKLKHRTSPLELHNSISQLTIAQKQSVRELRFGSILSLQIKDVPPKLSYWVLSHFDPKRSEIILGIDRRVHVAEDDVRLMFGFPRGQRKIEKPSLIETSDVIKEWRSQFERPPNRIRAIDVCIKMLEDRKGGVWFKKHFLDVDRASEFNWCAHVLKCLIEHTVAWKENTNKYFTGPTLFITLVYVDQVVLGYRRVARSIPAILEWKDMMILRRQNMEIVEGGFGQGYCDGPCREEDVGVPPVDEPDASGDKNENEDEQLNPMNADVIDDLSDMHTVAIGLLKQGKVISDALSTIMETVRKLPPAMLDNVAFCKTVEKELCSMPSFNLGLTQEWDSIVNLARDAVELAKKEAGINPDLHGTPHRTESSIMEDTSDVGRRSADTMGVNAPDDENAGNIADITEKGKGVTAVGKRKYKARGRGRVFKGKGKEEVRWGDVSNGHCV
ncbi:hypothetical protein C2S51_018972 [Perilla frutescens var. frutescens]|nr:hypothetical protein C2S51_018972 [Perilla frutescens var. frutescens]